MKSIPLKRGKQPRVTRKKHNNLVRNIEFSYFNNNGSFTSTGSENLSRHSAGSPSPFLDSDDDEAAEAIALLQPRHSSESFEERIPEIDIEPFLPELITDATAEKIGVFPPQSIMQLVPALSRAIARQFNSHNPPLPRGRKTVVSITPPASFLEPASNFLPCIAPPAAANHLAAVPYVITDPTKLIFDDWHFSFLYIHQHSEVFPSDVVVKEPEKSPSRRIFGTAKTEELHKNAAEMSLHMSSVTSLPDIALVRTLSVESKDESERPTPPALAPAPAPPAVHPKSVFVAIEPYFAKKTPRMLTLEGLPLGDHPRSLCHLFFVSLSVFAQGSLRKLQLPFCGITTRTLLMLVAGLHHSSSISQHLLTEIDLSHNLLTSSSIPVLNLLLSTSKIYSLALHGNPLGSAVAEDANRDEQHDHIAIAPPSLKSGADLAALAPRPPRVNSRRKTLRRSGAAVPPSNENQKKPSIGHFIAFIREGCAKLESLDLGFTHLDPAEQEVVITSIVKMTQLKTIALDGLKLTPNNAAKLAVAVVDSPSLWSVSVNFITNCTSPQYRAKLKLACEERKGNAQAPKLRRNVTFTRHTSQNFSLSDEVPSIKALMADKNFLNISNSEWVDDWNISEGYTKYTTNDPSLYKKPKKPLTAR
ncbi:Hypothetical protein, putative [Bodo saltans]|uniref:Leucine-rich repeat protein n=1 Tax=Bodo saltans TaxID=75058 RepID=A0A0S4IPS0_BODSA|nr:Hypothetical protein, putative [Bodo saltans]|eukprot:CUE71615.1 Hypothetical protein, putative [Bodo saltans]